MFLRNICLEQRTRQRKLLRSRELPKLNRKGEYIDIKAVSKSRVAQNVTKKGKSVKKAPKAKPLSARVVTALENKAKIQSLLLGNLNLYLEEGKELGCKVDQEM